jgi:hypothetical protein
MKLLASCDPKYLRVHAPALVASAAYHNNSIHINVCGASDGDRDILDDMSSKYHKIAGWPSSDFTWSMSTPMININDENLRRDTHWPDAERTAYACDRFLHASTVMENHKEDLLIIDTDCLVMQHIEPIKDDQIGLFLREPLPGVQGWETQGTRVAAGAVFVSQDAAPFLETVAARIRKGPVRLFLDQVALNEAYQEHMGDYRFRYFDAQFMDWEFVEGTTIWTGKGPRKYDNPTYLAKKSFFERMMR